MFVFFIFVVSNAGGLLTPLGDPPLFLGFLRGVPFTWTLRLWREWAFVNAAILLVFYIVDSTLFRREDLATPGDLDEIAAAHRVPLHVAGARNALWLVGVVAVSASGTLSPPRHHRGGARRARRARLVHDARGAAPRTASPGGRSWR